MLKIYQNAAGSTDLITGHRGHDGHSWTPSSHTLQILLLLSSLPSTAGMTDRHRHNGPSRVSVPKHLNSWNMGTGITSLNFITNMQDGPSQSRQTFVDYVTPHLVKLLEYGYCDYFFELHDKPAGWTVIDTMDRHKLRNPTLGQTSPSSFSSCTTLPPTDRHKHDGPSQAP